MVGHIEASSPCYKNTQKKAHRIIVTCEHNCVNVNLEFVGLRKPMKKYYLSGFNVSQCNISFYKQRSCNGGELCILFTIFLHCKPLNNVKQLPNFKKRLNAYIEPYDGKQRVKK